MQDGFLPFFSKLEEVPAGINFTGCEHVPRIAQHKNELTVRKQRIEIRNVVCVIGGVITPPGQVLLPQHGSFPGTAKGYDRARVSAKLADPIQELLKRGRSEDGC